jgi:hypothetical protein
LRMFRAAVIPDIPFPMITMCSISLLFVEGIYFELESECFKQ